MGELATKGDKMTHVRAGQKKGFPYDVFISYSQTDREWVRKNLVPRLESVGITYVDQHQFKPGHPRLEEIERAIVESHKVLLVLSPAYLADNWRQFDSVLASTYNLDIGDWRAIPIIIRPCELPKRLEALVSLDLCIPDESLWNQLISNLLPPMNEPLIQPKRDPAQHMCFHSALDCIERARTLLDGNTQSTREQIQSLNVLLIQLLDFLQELIYDARSRGEHERAVKLSLLASEISSARVELRSLGNRPYVRSTHANLQKLESASQRLRAVHATLKELIVS